MKSLLARILAYFRPKPVRVFTVFYMVSSYGDVIELEQVNYRADSVDMALAMHRSDYPRTTVTHVMGFILRKS